MRKLTLIWLIIVLFLPILPSTHAQEETSAANLLPHDTFFYFNIAGTTLPNQIDRLTANLLPETFQEMLVITPLFETLPFAAWLGERVTLALFPRSEQGLMGFIPAGALILDVRDETAAREFLDTTLPDWESDGYITLLPDAMILSDSQDSRLLDVQSGFTNSLADNHNFSRVQSHLSENPFFWAYFMDMGVATYLDEQQISLELIRPTTFTLTTQALTEDAIEGIPVGALAVSAGGFPSTDLATLLADLEILLGNELAAPINDLATDIIGVNATDDLQALFTGEYAVFLAYGRGTLYELYGVPLEGGIITAPDNPLRAALVAGQISNYLRDTYGFSIEQLTPTLFSLEIPNILDVYYGLASNRLYVTTPSGSDTITAALEGRNLTDDRRWQTVMALAPAGTQQITYFNLNGLLGLAALSPEFNSIPMLADVFDYLERYKSLAIYNGFHDDGFVVTKFSLLFD